MFKREADGGVQVYDSAYLDSVTMVPPPPRPPPSVISLVSSTTLSSGCGKKKRKRDENAYSTPKGKRHKPIRTTNISNECKPVQLGYEHGKFKVVDKCIYTEGPDKGEACVSKHFKKGSVFEERYFAEDIQNVQKAQEIVRAFNLAGIANKTIYMNSPAIWEDKIPAIDGSRAKYLVEPMIEGEFIKFNSNSGHVNGANVMQALSHFSYDHTGGQELLCDLQGGRYSSSYVLTDPVVMSRAGDYGVTDLGSKGISNFFSQHKCNEFCRPTWKKPLFAVQCLAVQEGTSMSLTLPLEDPQCKPPVPAFWG
jgi:hypothetical protein